MGNEKNNWLEIITDKEKISDNLIFTSFYIAIYESMVDFVEENVKSLLSDISVEDGSIKEESTNEYKIKIKNRVVDEKGNKDITKASFLFCVDIKIIDEDDYNDFLNINMLRNDYAHKLLNIVSSEIQSNDIDHFVKMVNLYKKISKNWFIEIEAPINGFDLTKDIDKENIMSGHCVVIEIMLDVLYRNKSEYYKELKNKLTEEDK